MAVSDRAYDRQTEARAADDRGSGGAGDAIGRGESAERFEEARDLVGRNGRAGVLDDEFSAIVACVCSYPDPASVGQVVLDAVFDEVLDQPLEEKRVAQDDAGAKLGSVSRWR